MDDTSWEPTDKPRCNFGVNCVRQNEKHLKNYSHPVANAKARGAGTRAAPAGTASPAPTTCACSSTDLARDGAGGTVCRVCGQPVRCVPALSPAPGTVLVLCAAHGRQRDEGAPRMRRCEKLHAWPAARATSDLGLKTKNPAAAGRSRTGLGRKANAVAAGGQRARGRRRRWTRTQHRRRRNTTTTHRTMSGRRMATMGMGWSGRNSRRNSRATKISRRWTLSRGTSS